jgi:hypothetical protein
MAYGADTPSAINIQVSGSKYTEGLDSKMLPSSNYPGTLASKPGGSSFQS